MERTKDKLLYGAFSMSAGLAGMALLPRCSGGGCAACFGCAVPGIGIVLLLLAGSRRKQNNGMA